MFERLHREFFQNQDSVLNKEEREETVWLPLDVILVAESQREKTDPKKVEKHRKDFEQDKDIVPIDVIRTDDGSGKPLYRILGNGRHRYFGAKAAGMTSVPVVIRGSRFEEEYKKAA